MTSLILSLYLFIAPFSANMVTPILDVIGRDINIPAGPQRTLILSVPLLTAGLGPLIWAPLVEKFGRKPLLRYTNAIFIIFNTACGFASTGAQLLVFRFLAAFGASSPGIVSGDSSVYGCMLIRHRSRPGSPPRHTLQRSAVQATLCMLCFLSSGRLWLRSWGPSRLKDRTGDGHFLELLCSVFSLCRRRFC